MSARPDKPSPLQRSLLLAQIGDCQARLELLEKRLGTPAEEPGDFARATDLAHYVNNLRTMLSFLTEDDDPELA